MTTDAPRSFNQHIFFDPKGVYYGTDDGYQDDSLAEFVHFEQLYQSAAPARRNNLHFVGAIGGLYSLNLMTCWQPSKITFFDINPHAVAYFQLVRRLISISTSKQQFLDHLTNADFDVENEAEAVIRENLALKQRGKLGRDRASAYKRSLERSWRYALDRFERTKHLLTDIPFEVRITGIESEEFAEFLRRGENMWVYCSNISEFTRSRLRFDHPGNTVVSAIIYPGQVDILDLAPFGDTPVIVDCDIPMKAAALNELIVPEDTPQRQADAQGRALAEYCRTAGLQPNGKILDMGCGWGRLGFALVDYLEEDALVKNGGQNGGHNGGQYEGIDCHREHLRWAKQNLSESHPLFTFHIANLRNRNYNPKGSLEPREFRFPYANEHFDMVVIYGVSAHLQPEELVHYIDEAARVLSPGGKLVISLHLIDENLPFENRFLFKFGKVIGTQPHGRGRLAYFHNHAHELLGRAGFEIELLSQGAWHKSGHKNEHNDRHEEDPSLVEDVFVAVKAER